VTDPSTSYDGQVLAYAAGMLAASATWALICNATAPAKSRIVLIDGGDIAVTGEDSTRNWDGVMIDRSEAPVAQVSIRTPMTEEEIGVGSYRRTGTIAIGLTIRPPKEYHPAQASIWATNAIGCIKKEIKDQQGQSGKLAKITVNSEQMTIIDGTGALGGCCQTIITIDWRA
jgi:hypothetical protein